MRRAIVVAAFTAAGLVPAACGSGVDSDSGAAVPPSMPATEPAPTEPAPTELAPTEPAPTGPDVTEPVDDGPGRTWCADVDLHADARLEAQPDGTLRLWLTAPATPAATDPASVCAVPRDVAGVDVSDGDTWTEVPTTGTRPGTDLPDPIARDAVTDRSYVVWLIVEPCAHDEPTVDGIRVRVGDGVRIVLDPVHLSGPVADDLDGARACVPVAVSPVFTFDGYG